MTQPVEKVSHAIYTNHIVNSESQCGESEVGGICDLKRKTQTELGIKY